MPKPWGGTNLKRCLGKKIPGEKIGESWELCCRNEGMSVVAEGKHRGRTLQELIHTYGEKLVGTKVYQKHGENFPLLIKMIDAADRLSVQVHPDDAQAHLSGEAYGKDEMWYIIDAVENAKLIYGVRGETSKEQLMEAIRSSRIIQLLNEVAVKPGHFFYIPGGTVHAILGGILIAEIQQNSNTTYRLYDWDRTDRFGGKRELHIPQAMKAIHFQAERPAAPFAAAERKCRGTIIRRGPKVKGFCVDELKINGTFHAKSTRKSFQVIMNLKGSGEIQYGLGCISLHKGDTVLIPAGLGLYRLSGKMLLLHTYADENERRKG